MPARRGCGSPYSWTPPTGGHAAVLHPGGRRGETHEAAERPGDADYGNHRIRPRALKLGRLHSELVTRSYSFKNFANKSLSFDSETSEVAAVMVHGLHFITWSVLITVYKPEVDSY